MSTNKPGKDNDGDEYGLIVQQPGEQQQELVKRLSLVLNYLYGFNILLARHIGEATTLSSGERGQFIRNVFVVQEQAVGEASLTTFTKDGTIPVFLVLPHSALAEQGESVDLLPNVHVITWEEAMAHGAGANLRERIEEVFEQNSIGGLFDRAQHVAYRILQKRVEKQLRNLHTLPTLPEVVLRIMEVISDANSTPEQSEEVLRSDPAIVHKLLQVVNTPAFAGVGHRGDWSLQEAIVRLGRRKLGSIALQIKLINSLIKPEESHFDLRRFWIHSVGSAHIADKIYSERLVQLGNDIGVKEYWVAALLHDVGKLILGFFFWSYFERVEQMMTGTNVSFREAEARLGDIVTHQQVGQLLLIRAAMGEHVVKVVGTHNDIESLPNALQCLVHLGDNLAKDFGLGYLPHERGHYDPAVLRAVNLDEDGLEALRVSLGHTVVAEIMEVVDRCT
jgi:HD-like signal output (HDOD) protein